MRSSALTLASKCRGSKRMQTGYGSIFSKKGHAFHEMSAAKVLMESLDSDEIQLKYGLNDKDMLEIKLTLSNVELNIPQGAKIFADNINLKTVLKHEAENVNVELTGTPDLFTIQDGLCGLIDWKQGWADVEEPETNLQFIAYNILIMDNFPEVQTIRNILVQPKINSIKTYTYHRVDIENKKKVVAQIIYESEKEDSELVTGPWCSTCFGCMNCPAFAGEVKALASNVVELIPDEDIKSVVAKLLPFAKAVNVVGKKVEALAKAIVDESGDMDLGRGMKYIKAEETRENIVLKKALPILLQEFDEAEVVERMKMTKSNLAELAKTKDKRGYISELLDDLRKKGAIISTTVNKYKFIKGVDNESVSNTGKINGRGASKKAKPRRMVRSKVRGGFLEAIADNKRNTGKDQEGR